MPTVQLSARTEKSVKGDLLDICRRTHRSQSYYTEKALAATSSGKKNTYGKYRKASMRRIAGK